MTPRKIRMTAVGLVAMPADRDEAHVSADDIQGDPELRTAFAELLALEASSTQDAEMARDTAGTDADRREAALVLEDIEAGWQEALDGAAENAVDKVRAGVAAAREAASLAGYTHDHEDAALAMLPEAAS